MRLTPAQYDALETLNEGAATPTAASVHIGKNWKRTLRALERLGLARYFPYGQDGEGSWRITPNGRRWIGSARGAIDPPPEGGKVCAACHSNRSTTTRTGKPVCEGCAHMIDTHGATIATAYAADPCEEVIPSDPSSSAS